MHSFLEPLKVAIVILATMLSSMYASIALPVRNQAAKTACQKEGKTFLTWCNGKYSSCLTSFADAGSPCTSKSQCQGFCIDNGGGKGACSQYPAPKQDYDQFSADDTEKRVPHVGGNPQIVISQPCPIQ
jgi:hypothetical protein